MKKYRCFDCGNIFGEDEIETVRESRGEFWGAPAYETIGVCPFCRSDEFDEFKENEEGDEDDSGTD